MRGLMRMTIVQSAKGTPSAPVAGREPPLDHLRIARHAETEAPEDQPREHVAGYGRRVGKPLGVRQVELDDAEEIEEAKGDLKTCEADLKLARQDLDRIIKGYKAFSVAEHDSAQATLSRAEGRLHTTRAHLKMLKDGTRPEDIADAEGVLAQHM